MAVDVNLPRDSSRYASMIKEPTAWRLCWRLLESKNVHPQGSYTLRGYEFELPLPLRICSGSVPPDSTFGTTIGQSHQHRPERSLNRVVPLLCLVVGSVNEGNTGGRTGMICHG